jgi:predicted TIM-barrel fold metal-dependent hydrolase
LYDPIYKAAAEMELPVVIHIAAGEQSWGSAQFTAGGLPGSYFEFHSVFTQPMMHHLTSFIVHGIFERYRNLKLVCMECGISWIPWLLWNLDDHYQLLRLESPWLKRLPSEYLRDHIRFSTQPLEESPQRKQLIELLESFGGMEDLLCFSSDYPHWDADNPGYVASRLPQAWHDKVFYENARQLFRWTPMTRPPSPSAQVEGQ